MGNTVNRQGGWKIARPDPIPKGQGDLFAELNMQNGKPQTTPRSVRQKVEEQLALPGIPNDMLEQKEGGRGKKGKRRKKAPTSPAASPPRTIFETTGLLKETKENDDEERWLKIDFKMERMFGISEAIRDRIDAALNDTKSFGTLWFENGAYFIHESDLPILERQISHHYHDDFTLPICGNTVTFKPEIATTDREAGRWAS